MPTQQAPERVTITLPEDVKDIFAWIKNYDPQFEGRDASIGAFLLKLGVETYYQRGLENIEPLDAAFSDALRSSGVHGMTEAMSENNSEVVIPQARAR